MFVFNPTFDLLLYVLRYQLKSITENNEVFEEIRAEEDFYHFYFVQLQFLCGTLNETIKPVNPLCMFNKITRVRKSLFPYVDRLNFQVISSWQPLSRATHSYLDTTWFPRVSAQWCCKKKIEVISIESDKRRNEDDKGVKMELSKLVVKCTQTSERLKSD